VTLQVSAVQTLLSLQSESAVQHPACAECSHVCELVLQVSVVQVMPSSQSPAVLQQLATGA
jgi:hypothetical protein